MTRQFSFGPAPYATNQGVGWFWPLLLGIGTLGAAYLIGKSVGYDEAFEDEDEEEEPEEVEEEAEEEEEPDGSPTT